MSEGQEQDLFQKWWEDMPFKIMIVQNLQNIGMVINYL